MEVYVKRHLCLAWAFVAPLLAAASGGYHIMQKVSLGGPQRWDYVAVDASARRVYVTHLTQVDVLDADSGAATGKIADLRGAHGVALDPATGRGFITNGEADSVTIFDLKTLKKIGDVPVGKKPDAILYDPATQRVFAMNGESDNATAIDAATGKVVGTVALGGGPEFAVTDGAGHVFVNLEDENMTLRVDSRTLKVTDRWPLAPCSKPSSLAIDAAHHRLFAGCRSKVMAVVDSETGHVIATPPIGERVDATSFDPTTGLVFNSTGQGTLDVFHEDTPDKYTAVESVTTLPGARTSMVDPKTHRVFVPAMDSGSFVVLILGQ